MRRLCTFALPFSGAVFLAVYCLPPRYWPLCGILCLAAALLGLRREKRARLRWLLLCLGLAAGLLWSAAYRAVFYAPAESLDGQTVSLTATAAGFPNETVSGCSLAVLIHPASGPSIRATLYLSADYLSLVPGDNITGSLSLRLANTLYGEQSSYNTSKGIYLTAYPDGALTVDRPTYYPLSAYPAVVAKAMQESIAAIFPDDTAGLIAAITTGDRTHLDTGLYAAMQRTGIAHVVAVSGMHVSFLAGFLATVLRRRRRTAAVAGMILVLFFAAVAGASPSVLRAAFLQVFLLLAPLLKREDDRVTSLSAVLMLLLAWNPFAAASVSLQLSFGAVAGIYLVTGPLYDRWMAPFWSRRKTMSGRVRQKALSFFFGTLSTTLGAMLFTTPLTAYYFGVFSVISPLINLLTLWAVSYTFLGGLLSALLGLWIPGAAVLPALLTSLPARYIRWVAESAARLPFAAVPTGNLYLQLWLFTVYAIFLLYLLRWVRRGRLGMRRLALPACACAATLCAAIFFQAASLRTGRLTVTVLDVGQGQSILLRSGGVTVLVDCGGTAAGNAGDIAADHLQSMGTASLDYLILTHCHTDHANGVPELLSRVRVGVIILPVVSERLTLEDEITALAAEQGIEVRYLDEDETLTCGESTLRLYAPLGAGTTNEEGLSLLCTLDDFDVLITGDMDSSIEQRLIKYGDLPDIELLIAGHHGSQYATSEALLLATMPEYAAISVGYNSYGHPTDETLMRLGAAGCDIYRTDQMGTITFTINE